MPTTVLDRPLATSTLTPEVRKQRLLSIAQSLRKRDQERFVTLLNVERIDLSTLQATPVADNVFEAIRGAALENDIMVGPTVGHVMSALGLTQPEVNSIACYCHNGTTVAAAHVASSLENIAGGGHGLHDMSF